MDVDVDLWLNEGIWIKIIWGSIIWFKVYYIYSSIKPYWAFWAVRRLKTRRIAESRVSRVLMLKRSLGPL